MFVERLADGRVAQVRDGQWDHVQRHDRDVELLIIDPVSVGGVTVEPIDPSHIPEPSLTTEACAVDASVCFRVAGQERIEASIDQGATWSSIWRIDHDSITVAAATGALWRWDGSAPIYDLAVADDGTLAFQMQEQRRPIFRLPDGTWSVDDGEFRETPIGLYGFVLTMALLGVATWTFGVASASWVDRRCTTLRFGVLAPTFLALVCSRAGFFHLWGWQFIVWPMIAVLVIAVLMLTDRVDRLVSVRWSGWLGGLISALVVAAVSVFPARVLWQEGDWIAATAARDAAFVAGLAAAAGAWIAGRALATRRWPPSSPPPPAFDDLPLEATSR